MTAVLIRTLAVILITPLVFVGMLNGLEHLLVYHPHPYRSNYQKLLAESGVLELPFEISTGKQVAFYLPPHDHARPPDRLWVLFCGNGSLALDWLPLVRRDPKAGDGFLLIDYPGYGNSDGWPSIKNTRAAAEGALAALSARLAVAPETLEPRVNVIGHSLGAAAALDFADRHSQVREVILFAPFTSLRSEAAVFIGTQLSHLLLANYDNRAALRHLSKRNPPPRVMIYHGLQDGMIPVRMGRDLAAEFPGFVTFRGMPEATHDTIVAEAADDVVKSFSQ